MDRRRFIKSITTAAGALAAASPSRSVFSQTRTVQSVTVIGAGIVGSSIAYYLSKRGCDVTIVDKKLPASQASGNTFAWINAAYANRPESYRQLRQRSLDEYRRLANDLPIPIRWSGSLEWFDDADAEAQLVRDIGSFQAMKGAATSMVDAEQVKDLEPNLNIANNRQLAWSTNDGAVDAAATTQALFDKALSLGASSRLFTDVKRIQERRGKLRLATSNGRLEADLVVVAAGVGSTALAKVLGESVDTTSRATPGIIVTTEPLPRMINTVLYPPRVHIHQQEDGRVVIGEKAGPSDSRNHRVSLANRPNAFPNDEDANAHVLRILAMARQYVPELSQVRQADVGIGWRPMPEDGLPIIGFGKHSPLVYYATMHSGVSLAPIVGRLAAEEILDGTPLPELKDFRPQRFGQSA